MSSSPAEKIINHSANDDTQHTPVSPWVYSKIKSHLYIAQNMFAYASNLWERAEEVNGNC